MAKQYLYKWEREKLCGERFNKLVKMMRNREKFKITFDIDKGWKIRGKPVGVLTSREFSTVFSWLEDKR